MIKVGVVILNYKVLEKVKACLSSVFKSDYENLQVYVLDNNSHDGSDEYFSSKNEVKFYQTDKNLGYSGGNNIGIDLALKDNCQAIFILNPDTEIEPTTVTRLVKALETGVGIAGPKIFFSNSKKIWYAGGIFDSANVLGSHRGVNEEDHGQFNELAETDYVTGAAMMVKREVFERIGILDDNYFLYYEDTDFCLRAKKAGFKIVYAPAAVVYHENAQSTGIGSSLQDYFITRNRLLLARKFLPFRTQFALIREAIRNLAKPIRRQAFFDFLLGNLKGGSFIND